jgi:putative glutamine amidotransferase
MTHSSRGRPVIGITAHRGLAKWAFWQRDTDLLTATYADAVAAAGGCPVLLPARPEVPPVVSRLDGVVLSGGPDLDPALYGEPAHPQTLAARPERDAAELAVLATAARGGIPVLAVCRGAQLLNVWCGGSLEQHIYDVPGRLHHGEGGEFSTRDVSISDGSWLAQVIGRDAKVPCHHHQAVGRLGRGLQAVAWAEDGTVEAIELDGPGTVIGVQWHPEEDSSSALFEGLVREAASTRDSAEEVREGLGAVGPLS